jgi:hypothetical protein
MSSPGRSSPRRGGPVTGGTAQPAPQAVAKQRSPLAHLLHALNQPLTGLQCSLELAVAGPRRPEQYVRILNEGLELTLRMRTLVEAIRELTDDAGENQEQRETLALAALLRETADELCPVAAARGVLFVVSEEASPLVWGERKLFLQLLFRTLESALSLARGGSDLRITVRNDRESAVLEFSWQAAPAPSPFSRAELGLLVAGAGWEKTGGEWASARTEEAQTCTLRLPRAAPAGPTADGAEP